MSALRAPAPLAALAVPAWSPAVRVSDAAVADMRIARFRARVAEGFVAQPPTLGPPQALLVTGDRFAVVTRKAGLIDSSIHTLGPHAWHQLFARIARMRSFPAGAGPAPIIAAGADHHNHYHWTLESGGAMLLAQRADPAGATPLVVPVLGPRQRELLDLLGVANPLIELGRDEAAAFDAAVLASCIGREAGLAPHPALLAHFRTTARVPDATTPRRRRIYAGRLDTPERRPIANEAALAARLEALGFESVSAGSLPLAEQAALFRDADIVVAPHGAALANLVYARDGADGPAVVELLSEAQARIPFAKLCQAKRLRYTAIINPSIAGEGWRADIPLIEATVRGLLPD